MGPKHFLSVKPDYVDLFLGNGFDGGGGHVVSLLNVTCIVDHVFPEPEIAIFHTSGLNRYRKTKAILLQENFESS